MTFSVVARCPRSGELGVAVSSAVPAVGSICPFVRSGVGAVTTQSWVNPYLALDVLDRLAAGDSAEAVLAAVMAGDPAREVRQLALVDGRGGAAAWTGAECTAWNGQRTGSGFVVLGNMLAGEAVVADMERAFLDSEGEPLSERLLRVLEAGDAAGGDMRGRQSASLRVVGQEAYPLLDLRVDDHPAPVAELRRVYGVALAQLAPFIAGMPRRGEVAGPMDPAVIEMLMHSPPDRPGGGGSRPGEVQP